VPQNRLQNRVAILRNLPCSESKRLDPQPSKGLVSRLIPIATCPVMRPVDLDREHRGLAEEVEHITLDRMLPAELVPTKTSGA
jgi:hypothetical protein